MALVSIFRHVHGRFFSGKYRLVWRFNPSTVYGQPRPLVFLSKDLELSSGVFVV